MEKSKIDTKALCAIMATFGTNNHLDRAIEIFEIKFTEFCLEKDTISYNTIIYCSGQDKQYGTAFKYLETMIDGGIAPDKATASILYEICRRVDKMDKYLEFVKKHKLIPYQ